MSEIYLVQDNCRFYCCAKGKKISLFDGVAGVGFADLSEMCILTLLSHVPRAYSAYYSPYNPSIEIDPLFCFYINATEIFHVIS